MTTSSLLWLRGDAGSGKSYLTSLVVEDLLQPHLDMQTLLAFFYCSRTSGQSERQEPRDILRSIVRQLSSPVTGLPLKPPVLVKYKQKRLAASPPATLGLKESKELIKELIQDGYSSITIIIDGLDECNSQKRGDIFRYLVELLRLPGTVVKIFICSRNEPDIFESFGDLNSLCIDASNNTEDIRRFVEQEVETRLLGGKADDGLKEMVKKKLCEKAQGIFRWVALQLDAICDPEFVYIADDVKHKLQKLAETLQQTYAGIFEMISKYPPDSREVTERALRWSMCAQQLLSTQEFLAAISMNSDGRYVRRTKHEILRMCRSLLVDEKLDTFRLSHLSVKEYIEESKPLEYGEIQLHTTAAETCLLFLDYGNKNLRNDPKVAGFYKYAVIYWPNHCYMAA
ncbi:hypothetical protein MMC22_003812 [Lobaria immixta]|nr:hypothetical protein [Lobaria immixta]